MRVGPLGRPYPKNVEAKCHVCGTEFMAHTTRTKYCSPKCTKIATKERVKLNPPRTRTKEESTRARLKSRFGISLEQYNEILEAQDGGCAVCGKTPEEEGRMLAVDHDHKTGEIFGLLCWWCNHKIIGRERRSSLFIKAGEYLSKGLNLFVPEKMRNPRKKRRKKSS